MPFGFRGWLFRGVAICFGVVGLLIALTGAEISRLYGFGFLVPEAWIGLIVSWLVLASALVGVWKWRRFAWVAVILALPPTVGYLAFRPEMVRDDILAGLVTPPLTIDLVVYRGIILRGDPERELKVERLQLLYSLLRSYRPRPQ